MYKSQTAAQHAMFVQRIPDFFRRLPKREMAGQSSRQCTFRRCCRVYYCAACITFCCRPRCQGQKSPSDRRGVVIRSMPERMIPLPRINCLGLPEIVSVRQACVAPPERVNFHRISVQLA